MLMREHAEGGTGTTCPILAAAWGREDKAHCLEVNCMWWVRDPSCDHADHDAADDDSGCAFAVIAHNHRSVSYNLWRMARGM